MIHMFRAGIGPNRKGRIMLLVKEADNMNKWQFISAIIVIIAPLAVIVYDLIVNYLVGFDATITSAVRYMAAKWDDLPFVAAGLFLWLWLHLFFEVLMQRLHHV